MTAIALTGWLIIPRLTISLQSASKRKRFRSYIELLRRKIESTDEHEFVFKQRELMDTDDLAREVLEIRHCIRGGQITRFDTACAVYKTVQFTRYENTLENKHAKGKLVSLLGEISQCAK